MLSYESNLRQLLALSNVLLSGKNSYDRELDTYFTSATVDAIRRHTLDNLNYILTGQKVPKNMVIDLITIASKLSDGMMTNAVKRIFEIVTDNMDPILVKLLLCFEALIETLPLDNQRKSSKEYEFCTRYLQPFFQPAFNSDCDDRLIFKWTNVTNFNDNRNDGFTVAKNRPDGCVTYQIDSRYWT